MGINYFILCRVEKKALQGYKTDYFRGGETVGEMLVGCMLAGACPADLDTIARWASGLPGPFEVVNDTGDRVPWLPGDSSLGWGDSSAFEAPRSPEKGWLVANIVHLRDLDEGAPVPYRSIR